MASLRDLARRRAQAVGGAVRGAYGRLPSAVRFGAEAGVRAALGPAHGPVEWATKGFKRPSGRETLFTTGGTLLGGAVGGPIGAGIGGEVGQRLAQRQTRQAEQRELMRLPGPRKRPSAAAKPRFKLGVSDVKTWTPSKKPKETTAVAKTKEKRFPGGGYIKITRRT